MSYSLIINNEPVKAFNLTGSQAKRILAENVVDITFSTTAYINIPIGLTITVYGEQYRLNKLASWKKISDRHYEYKLHLEAVSYDLINYQFLFYNELNQPTEPQFALMGNADTFIDLIIKNANRVGAEWVKGNVDATGFRNLLFNSENCLQVLTRLAQEYDTEFWIDGKTINFTKKGVASNITLSYGKGNGLYDITRNNTDDNLVTRLYAFGGTKNIPGDYRNFSTRLKMPASTGAYIEQNVNLYGVIEHTLIFDDIFPQREGTVSAVDASNPLLFTDASIDFDVNAQLLPGVAAKVVFSTGQLAGYEFDIAEGGYNHSTKTFALLVNKDEKALEVPSTLLRPAIGDKYVLIDLLMPQSYIDAEELKVQTKALEYLTKNSHPRVVYSVTTDSFHFARTNTLLTLGNYVQILVNEAGVNENPRIIGYSRDINNEFLFTNLDLSDTVQVSGIVRQFAKQEKIERAIAMNRLYDPNRARNNWQNTQALLAMIFDPEGNYYSDKIKPGSIETQMLQVGARSQQLETTVTMYPNFGGNDNNFRSGLGLLYHFAIDPDSVRTWTINASVYDGLLPEAYYIYAKCFRSGTTGTILLSTEQIKLEQDLTFYHFLLGVLHAPLP